eukprot:gene21465-22336_t
MCHFVLPARGRPAVDDVLDGRYGEEALLRLQQEVHKHDTQTADYTVKVFGGASVLGLPPGEKRIGQANTEFVLAMLRRLHIKIAAQDLAGEGYRYLRFELNTGDVWVRHGHAELQAVLPSETSSVVLPLNHGSVMQDLLAPCTDISVIATAADPIFAMSKMRNNWPDVIVLDVEMPRMDGITFLRQIMAIRPTPVVICSSHADPSSAVTMEAVAAGAVDFIRKPALGIRDFLHDSSEELVAAIRAAAQVSLPPLQWTAAQSASIERQMRMDGSVVAENVHDGTRLNADAILSPPSYLD